MRIMGSVDLKQNEIPVHRKWIFRAETYKNIMTPKLALQLVAITQEQRQLLAA